MSSKAQLQEYVKTLKKEITFLKKKQEIYQKIREDTTKVIAKARKDALN